MGNWELADGPLANDIERLNLASLKNVLVALIGTRLAQRGSGIGGVAQLPDETALRQLHHAATVHLLVKPGRYRSEDVRLVRDGVLTFQPPPWQDVKRLMRKFFRELAALWNSGDALDVAAYALWRIGWIHPFKDGNGRTAFAFSYACLCIKLGALLPDGETLLDQILADPGRCNRPLRIADEAYARSNQRPDLHALKIYLDELLMRQMIAAQQRLSHG